MAELAFGISKTAVEALANKVKSAIKEEEEKWQIVGRDVVFIKDEFEMMQSFLNTAGGERMKNQVARTWVRQVRDLSYDTEDCIEYVLHLDTKRSFWKRLLRFNMVQTMLPLDQAVAEIKQLKGRAEDVNQRNMRYSLVSDPGEQMRQMTASQRTLDIIKKPTDAFNNQEDILDLNRLIKTEHKGLQVIAVCGTGGDLGINSIIKKAYDDPEICQMFECRAWVQLTHPFNPHDFIRSLLAGFYANSSRKRMGVPTAGCSHTRWGVGKRISVSRTLAKFTQSLLRTLDLQGISGEQEADAVQAMMKATQERILTDFMDRIRKKTYFIVLEDVSSIVEWNAIRMFMPDMKNRSRIVVSTQQLEIASLCTGHPNHEWLLRKFSTDHSVYAFFKELPKKLQSSDRKRCTMEQIGELLRDDSRDRLTAHWQEHHNIFGREPELKKFGMQIRMAYYRRASTVISVWGVAGVGKSFLVGALCDHYAAIFDSCAVVSASHPFNINNFCQNLAHDLKPPECDDIFLRILRHLEGKQCLVIIDGLWSKEDWDTIETSLISRSCRSCIIVISREESVARHCATSDEAMFKVKGLEADATSSLLKKETTKHGGTSAWDPNMMKDAELFINKCGRLPKLTVALVKYLAGQRNVIREARRLNANFINALKTREGLDSFREVFTWIYSNFQACPELHKKCVFYLSIFTQSSIIRRSRLVRRWIAEGYSEGTDCNSNVEYTESLINVLANLGMMEYSQETPTVAGDMTYCHINSLILEYVISQETEDNIFLPLEISVLQGEAGLNRQPAGQHLSIGSSWKRDKFVYDNLDFSRLRSLTVSREWRPFLISDRMRVLRVLDLEDTNVNDDDIQQITEQLDRLKFLSLRRCIKVSCLPESLGDLRQLQTLDIRHTSVTKLPKSISKLHKLQYVRAAKRATFLYEEPSTSLSSHGHVADPCDGVMLTGGIGALTAMHTLGVVNVSARGGQGIMKELNVGARGGQGIMKELNVGARGNKAILKDLKNLTQLHKLGVSGINRSNFKGFFSAIVGHRHLESLSLQLHIHNDKDLEWLGKITPPGKLRRLKMYVHVVKYPQYWNCLHVLGQIRRLQTLSLRFEMDQDIELPLCDSLGRRASRTPGQFSELKVLEIACSSNLHVKFAIREMKELEILKVHCLNGSSLQFSGIERPLSLKHVCLKGSFDDTLKEELQRQVAQHPRAKLELI